MFSSSTGGKSEAPSGSIDQDQDLIKTDQILKIPSREINNSQDLVLEGEDKSMAPKKQESAEESGHVEDRSQEVQSTNLETTSSSLGQGAKGSGSLFVDCEQELDKAVERALKDALIINDGACFFGDLESEEGVSVEMKLDEEAASGKALFCQNMSVPFVCVFRGVVSGHHIFFNYVLVHFLLCISHFVLFHLGVIFHKEIIPDSSGL